MLDVADQLLLLAITKIRWPGCKKDVFHYVFASYAGDEDQPELGIECSQRVISEWTGISRTLVRRYLAELVDEKVLECHPGGGPRAHAFRPGAEFDIWRSRWFGAWTGFDSDWPLKRARAVAELECVLARLTAPVARTGGPVGLTAARQSARLRRQNRPQSRASGRATGRAVTDQLSAREAERVNAADTSISNLKSNYLASEISEEADFLLQTIEERAGVEVFGKLADEVVALVGNGESADLAAAVRRAQPKLPIKAYIELAGRALNRRRFAATKPSTPDQPPPIVLDDEPGAPPPHLGTDMTAMEYAQSVARSCETASGGSS